MTNLRKIRSGGSITRFDKFEKKAIEQSIGERFESQVRKCAHRRAVNTRTDDLTYAELNRRANRIAHALVDLGGTASEPVGLILEQGVASVAAILGVLKSGKFYLPIDPSYPQARMKNMLEDAEIRLVVTDEPNLSTAKVLTTEKIRILHVDEIDADVSDENPNQPVEPDRLAYMFYTSGSTGRPKGVVDNHRNVLHNIMRYTNSLHISADDRLTLLQSCSFSGSVSSLFGALLNGASLFPFDLRAEGFHCVADTLIQKRITIYHSVPSIFRLVAVTAKSFPDVRLIRLEGDQASSKDVEIYRRHFSDECILVNGLGATECGLVRQYFVDNKSPVPTGVLPIGSAVEDMEVVLLGDDDGDREGNDTETDFVGEIAVRSLYLSPGYWRRPDLTARAFAVDAGADGRRTYRTGDLGRMRADGCLEYLGRKDAERKVNGQRIDVTEVETALLGLQNVDEAVVQILDDRNGDPKLVAHVVATQPVPTVSEMRQDLSEKLPVSMIPSAYIYLESLPLTMNGKVDRRKLPALGQGRPAVNSSFQEPRTALQSRLAGIWSEVLNLERVGIGDRFFDLGGDSLTAAKVSNRMHRDLGVDLNFATILKHPTISMLAKHLEADFDLGSI